MGKKILVVFFIFISFSCSKIEPSYLVFRGNYKTRQGAYQDADVDYLRAIKMELHPSLIYYNQGNLYYFLGEPESALHSWNLAEEQEGHKLPYRLHFNRGVLYYDQGDFEKAYWEFREALEMNPTSIDTKINLELTLAKLGRGNSGGDVEKDQSTTQLDDTERLLYYIENKERQQWSGGMEPETRSEQDW